jgi:hypothetical protein
MSDTLEIVVSGSLPCPQIELSPAAFNARTMALEASGRIKAIASVADLDAAAGALTKLKSLTRSVEDSRKEVKAPVLEVGKRIDATAKDYLAPLEVEAKRLSVIVGAFQEAARRKAEKDREEAARVQAEALAELNAKQAEALANGDEAAADAARAEAADKIAASQLAVIAAEGPKPEGIVTRTSWKFEVVDINALHAARPELCLIEPNNAAIRAVVKTGAQIPGLRVWQEAGAIVRGTTQIKPEEYDY